MPSTIDEANQEMPLFISRNGHVGKPVRCARQVRVFTSLILEDIDSSPSLFAAGPTAFSNDTDLYVSGPITGTKEELDLWCSFPDSGGDMSCD